jgi:1,5-anhydro-D-fructose reductase (1,5-anhydro-D-mannitol-forming)
MNKIRFGILGTSGHADRVAAPVLLRSPAVALLGAAGSSPGSGAQFAARHGLARAYADLDALLADPDIDAIWICSPNHLHAGHVARCAAARKHVLVEKPLATSRADAQAAGRAAADAGIVLRVGCQHRFRPSHQRIRELLLAGAIGKLGYARIHRFWRYPYFEDMDPSGPPQWRRSPEASGGWIINDIGSHLLDLLLWMCDSDAVVAGAVMAAQKFAVATEDSTAVLLRLGANGIGMVETSCANESPGSRIEIYGSDGWLRADDTLSGAARIDTHRGVDREFPALPMLDAYFAQVADFAAAVRGVPGIGAGADAGIAVASIIEAAVARGHASEP